jgi:hypothetical protein
MRRPLSSSFIALRMPADYPANIAFRSDTRSVTCWRSRVGEISIGVGAPS